MNGCRILYLSTTNFRMTGNGTHINFSFDRKPSEETLVQIRPYMKWDPGLFTWVGLYSEELWDYLEKLGRETVLPAQRSHARASLAYQQALDADDGGLDYCEDDYDNWMNQ